VSLVEFLNCLRYHNVIARYPQIFFCAIALPLHQILHLLVLNLTVKDTLDVRGHIACPPLIALVTVITQSSRLSLLL
jgi:hypothetical protein